MGDYEYDGSERSSWKFVGECGGYALLDQHGAPNYLVDTDQYLIWLKTGLAFLRYTFEEEPAGCTLGILWASGPHSPGKFPIIAVGSDNWTPEALEYHAQLEKALIVFDKAVDWG